MPLSHELPSKDAEPSEEDEFVTVATFGNRFDASVARGALESSGIPALVPGESMGSFALNRTGAHETWIELKVRSIDRDRAAEFLKDAGHT